MTFDSHANFIRFFFKKTLINHGHVHGIEESEQQKREATEERKKLEGEWERGAVERAQAECKCCRRCTTWGRCRECSYRMRSSLGCCPPMSRPSLSGNSPRRERREAFSRASLLLDLGNAGACSSRAPRATASSAIESSVRAAGPCC